MQSLCARVPKERGELFRKILSEAHIIDNELMVKHNDRFLYIPLRSRPDPDKQPELAEAMTKDIAILDNDFECYPQQITSYKTLVDVPTRLVKDLPTSYDIIGSIALVKIPETLTDFSNEIGEAILTVNKSIRTVALDNGVVGALRTRDLDIIAGEPRTETKHKEYGVTFILDVAKVYFSPRLGGEHYRISQLVLPGEIVLDMFAGIGPFSIMIAKYSKARSIYSIDMNKHAIEYLIKNVDLNKIQNIYPLEGDAHELMESVPKVDRIIMNLPLGGDRYLADALDRLKPRGTIHYHEMVRRDELAARRAWLQNTVKKHGFEISKFTENNLGSYSPKIDHYCFDLMLLES